MFYENLMLSYNNIVYFCILFTQVANTYVI